MPVVAAARDLRILTEVSRGIVPIETRAAGVVMRSDDTREGPLAFMEKRKPPFTADDEEGDGDDTRCGARRRGDYKPRASSDHGRSVIGAPAATAASIGE